MFQMQTPDHQDPYGYYDRAIARWYSTGFWRGSLIALLFSAALLGFALLMAFRPIHDSNIEPKSGPVPFNHSTLTPAGGPPQMGSPVDPPN